MDAEHRAGFLVVARPQAREDLARWHATLEELTTADGPDGTTDAVAVVGFRGRRYRYRRRVWPAAHPAALQASLYVTTLVELLLTTPAPAGMDAAVIDL